MTVETCIYKSVTLQPGESFILPPGATLVSASDSGSLESENDCLDLTNLGGLSCFGVDFGAGNRGSVYFCDFNIGPVCITHRTLPADNSPFDCNTYIYGIRVNGVEYTFKTSSGAPTSFNTESSVAAMMACFNSTPIGPIILNLNKSYRNNPIGDSGRVSYLGFKTLDEIGSDFSLLGVQQSCDTQGPDVYVEYKIKSYSKFTSSEVAAFPSCS